MGLTKPIVKSA